MALERKLAMFEKLGGTTARAVAERFWTGPNPETWAAYTEACLGLYNTQPAADADARRRIVFHEAILFASAGGEQRTMNLLPGLAGVRCPVLVMAGAQDPVCPLADSEDIFAALPAPHRELAVFAGSGHGAWRDEPDAAFARLRRFITGS
jgi:proline iminopeptidase